MLIEPFPHNRNPGRKSLLQNPEILQKLVERDTLNGDQSYHKCLTTDNDSEVLFLPFVPRPVKTSLSIQHQHVI